MTNHFFERKSGTGSRPEVKRACDDSFWVTNPQFTYIRNTYFSGRPGFLPDEKLLLYCDFPIVSGYVLGVVEGVLEGVGISLNPSEAVWCVADIDIVFQANSLDLSVMTHFILQQRVFRLGLSMGKSDFSLAMRTRGGVGRVNLEALTLLTQVLLESDSEKSTKSNLAKLFGHFGMPKLSGAELSDVVDSWNEHREYVIG